ncbi:MFS transporter [Paracandidimonas soli]|uniref:MFS transporter n=1 Tax=Paracandidimonas soli TaxID=1917182 RepID=UPI003DA7410D
MSRSYRWVIVAVGGLLGCVAFGAMFSLPVFLRPMAQDTGWSVTGISAAMTIAFLSMGVASLAWGSLSDRFGPRLVVLAGTGVLAVGLAFSSRTASLGEFQLLFAVLA